MAYTIQNPAAGFQPIAVTDTVQRHALGTIVAAIDPTYGLGEFIYLLGVASTVVGSVVTYNGQTAGTPTFQTTLAAATAGQACPVGVSMSVNVASQYGWYQISGNAVAATNGTMTANVAAYLAGSGAVTSTQAAGVQVLGARSVTATGTPAASQCVLEMNRSHAQGQIV